MRESGCDAVMVGRALVGNPWLMRAARLWAGGMDPNEADRRAAPDMEERLRILYEHGRLMHEQRGSQGPDRVPQALLHLPEGPSRCPPGAARTHARLEALDDLREKLDRFYGPDGECLRGEETEAPMGDAKA